MKLLELVKKGLRKKVEVDGIEVWFKKLNFGELEEVQNKINEIQKKADEKAKKEDGDEINIRDHLDPTIEALSYLLNRYITDENGEKIIEEEEVENLPVLFCSKLLEKFLEISQGVDIDDLKKK